MTLPLSVVVPPASVVKLAAATVELKRVAPPVLTARAPSGIVPPTAPSTVIAPVPADSVRRRGEFAESLSTVPRLSSGRNRAMLIGAPDDWFPVVDSVTSAPNTTRSSM